GFCIPYNSFGSSRGCSSNRFFSLAICSPVGRLIASTFAPCSACVVSSSLGLQQCFETTDEVHASVARVVSIKIDGKKKEWRARIQVPQLFEGRTARLHAGAADDHTRLQGAEKGRSIAEVARGRYFEACALEHGRHIREKIAGRVDTEDLSVRGSGMRFDGRGPQREGGQRVLFRVVDIEHAVQIRGAQDLLNERRNVAKLEITMVGAERAYQTNECAQGSAVHVTDCTQIEDVFFCFETVFLDFFLERANRVLN